MRNKRIRASKRSNWLNVAYLKRTALSDEFDESAWPEASESGGLIKRVAAIIGVRSTPRNNERHIVCIHERMHTAVAAAAAAASLFCHWVHYYVVATNKTSQTAPRVRVYRPHRSPQLGTAI